MVAGMSLVANESGANNTLSGRRSRSRLRVRLPARLVTRSETLSVVLNDLSLNGAQITVPIPLRVGCEAVIEWARFEAFGEVVWTGGGRCGLAFFDPITQADLLATRELNETAGLPQEKELVRQTARQWVEGTARL